MHFCRRAAVTIVAERVTPRAREGGPGGSMISRASSLIIRPPSDVTNRPINPVASPAETRHPGGCPRASFAPYASFCNLFTIYYNRPVLIRKGAFFFSSSPPPNDAFCTFHFSFIFRSDYHRSGPLRTGIDDITPNVARPDGQKSNKISLCRCFSRPNFRRADRDRVIGYGPRHEHSVRYTRRGRGFYDNINKYEFIMDAGIPYSIRVMK